MRSKKLATHAHSWSTRYFIVQNTQSSNVKGVCRFDRLTSHNKRSKCHMNIEKVSSTHVFSYIVLRVNPGLTSCEDLVTTLLKTLFFYLNVFQHGHASSKILIVSIPGGFENPK